MSGDGRGETMFPFDLDFLGSILGQAWEVLERLRDEKGAIVFLFFAPAHCWMAAFPKLMRPGHTGAYLEIVTPEDAPTLFPPDGPNGVLGRWIAEPSSEDQVKVVVVFAATCRMFSVLLGRGLNAPGGAA